MSEFLSAIDEFLARASKSGSLDELQQAMSKVFHAFAQAEPPDYNAALHKLAAVLAETHPLPAAKIAMTCGAIVENGGDPNIAGAAILALLPDTLDGALQFQQHCAELAEADGVAHADEEESPDLEGLAEKYFPAIYEEHPACAFAYLGEQDLSLAAISHLSRSKELRAQARARPELYLHKSLALDETMGGGHGFLTKMLMVLDDEPLLILDAEQRKGFRAVFSGIADNFMLHTVLMGHLLGNPREGWLTAPGVNAQDVQFALTHTCEGDAPVLVGAFNLWNWTGLLPDGALPEAAGASDHWIWNEGVPADILPFEDERVVVLGAPPYERTWRGGSSFGGLLPEFTIREHLSPSEVDEWLQKLGKLAAQR